MNADAAQLSSASSMVDEIVARVLDVARRYEGTDRDDIVHQLHEVERALRVAGRQLDGAVRALG
jgi:hypothetical protein